MVDKNVLNLAKDMIQEAEKISNKIILKKSMPSYIILTLVKS